MSGQFDDDEYLDDCEDYSPPHRVDDNWDEFEDLFREFSRAARANDVKEAKRFFDRINVFDTESIAYQTGFRADDDFCLWPLLVQVSRNCAKMKKRIYSPSFDSVKFNIEGKIEAEEIQAMIISLMAGDQ